MAYCQSVFVTPSFAAQSMTTSPPFKGRLKLSGFSTGVANIADHQGARLDLAPTIFRSDEALQGLALPNAPGAGADRPTNGVAGLDPVGF